MFVVALCLVSGVGFSVCETDSGTKTNFHQVAQAYYPDQAMQAHAEACARVRQQLANKKFDTVQKQVKEPLQATGELSEKSTSNTATTKELIRRLSTTTYHRQALEDVIAKKPERVHLHSKRLSDGLLHDDFTHCYKNPLQKSMLVATIDTANSVRTNFYDYNEHECHSNVPGQLFAALFAEVCAERSSNSTADANNKDKTA